jgi:membrane protein YdbS with pleckstrin-like domain
VKLRNAVDQNPEPPYDLKVRRQSIHLAWLYAAIMLVLICLMVASFSGSLPTWVSNASSFAALLVTCVVLWRAEEFQRR